MSIQSVIPLALFVVILLGGLLWWHSYQHPDRSKPSSGIPDTYTAANVRQHTAHYVEENGVVQAFTVVTIHGSGYFLVEVIPAHDQVLGRSCPRIRGWTRELSSDRLVTKHCLLDEIPFEIRLVTN